MSEHAAQAPGTVTVPGVLACGSYSGYQQHCKRGEQPCDACKAANRDYHRAYRRAARDKRVERQYGGCVAGLGWPRYPGPTRDGGRL